jgi:hypothetical protein
VYPDILPEPLGNWNSATFTHGHFFVWKGAPNTDPTWFSINYKCLCWGKGDHHLVDATFSRGPVSDISKAINLSQQVQGHVVGSARLRGRRLYRFQTDQWFGYMWEQQGFAYSLFARYSRRVGWRFVRQFVESLYPLGRLWTGRTSQGKPVSLYLSRGGLEWGVNFKLNCADGSYFPGAYEGDLIGVKHNGTFVDSYASHWTSENGMLQNETYAMRGRFPAAPGAPVSGSFQTHSVSVHDPRDRSFNCGARVSWQASPVSGAP